MDIHSECGGAVGIAPPTDWPTIHPEHPEDAGSEVAGFMFDVLNAADAHFTGRRQLIFQMHAVSDFLCAAGDEIGWDHMDRILRAVSEIALRNTGAANSAADSYVEARDGQR